MSDEAKNYLSERGVLEETFTRHEGEIDLPLQPEKISQRLARSHHHVCSSEDWRKVTSVLWFKVWGANGEFVHYLARPLPSYGNAKFVAPIGSDSMPWIPQETRGIMKDIDNALVITEGPIKAMTLLQSGAFPIGLFGVWGVAAAKKKATPIDPTNSGSDDDRDNDDNDHSEEDLNVLKIHPELAYFSLDYRQVMFCFDADHLRNRSVRQAEIRAFMLLHAAGAEVYQLTTWPLAEGKGVDDYLVRKAGTDLAEQKEVFDELRGKAKPFIETLGRQDIDFVRKELFRTQDDSGKFQELAKTCAKQMKVRVSDLAPAGFERGAQGESGMPSGAKAIQIPPTAEPWGEPVVAQEVLDEIITELKRFVVMKESVLPCDCALDRAHLSS